MQIRATAKEAAGMVRGFFRRSRVRIACYNRLALKSKLGDQGLKEKRRDQLP